MCRSCFPSTPTYCSPIQTTLAARSTGACHEYSFAARVSWVTCSTIEWHRPAIAQIAHNSSVINGVEFKPPIRLDYADSVTSFVSCSKLRLTPRKAAIKHLNILNRLLPIHHRQLCFRCCPTTFSQCTTSRASDQPPDTRPRLSRTSETAATKLCLSCLRRS